MQITVEKVSSILCRLTVVVPADKIEEAYSQQINRFAKQANIKGFRPGKAPMSHIVKQFGDSARKEALGEVIQRSLYDALAEKKLNPVSTPQVEPKLTGANQPLEYTASFEVLPEIDKVAFSMKNVEKLNVEVKDEDLNRVVDQLTKQYTKWAVVDRAANKSDRVVIDYYAIYDGKSEIDNKVQNYPIELGANIMLPGFEEGLIGTKAGDEKTLALHYPADFGVADKAGKPIEFVVKVKQVFEANKPAFDENFFKQLGIKSGKEEDLKKQIRQSLEMERDRLVKEKLKEQVFRQLLEQHPLEIPSSLIQREAGNIHDEVYPQHEHHDHHHHSDEETTMFNDIAKKRISLGLLVGEFSKEAKVSVDAARVKARIQEIASSYENPQEVVTWLSEPERKKGIESQVMEDQVLEALLKDVPVTEKTMTFAELKGVHV